MINILGIKFGSKYPSTQTLEKKNKLLEDDFNRFESINNSDKLKRYEELNNLVHSQDYIKKVASYNKKEYKKSEEFKQLNELKQLKKDSDLKWFLKKRNSNYFDELNKWTVTFEDYFDGSSLDNKKWMCGYYWGKAILNDDYVQAGEKQFFKKDNVKISGGKASIITKNEKCKGKEWNPELGFVPSEFDYSSGFMSTGHSFRQKYGKFEAKIKTNQIEGINNVFALLSENIAPQIDILKTDDERKNYISSAVYSKSNNNGFAKNINEYKIPGNDNFFIYSIEWTKDKLEWKINDVVVNTQTSNVPQEPMYIALSTHINDKFKSNLPVSMDVEWVKCYSMK